MTTAEQGITTVPEAQAPEMANAPAPAKTPQEILADAEVTIAQLRTDITIAVGAGEDFTDLAARLTHAVTGKRTLFQKANADKVTEEKSKMSNAIYTLLQHSPLAELLDEKVRSVFWELTSGSGDNGDIITLTVNGARRAPSPQRPGVSTGTGDGATRNAKTYSVNGGEALKASDFVVMHGPESVQNDGLVRLDANNKRKFPSKPKFIEETIRHLESEGRTVTISE